MGAFLFPVRANVILKHLNCFKKIPLNVKKNLKDVIYIMFYFVKLNYFFKSIKRHKK